MAQPATSPSASDYASPLGEAFGRDRPASILGGYEGPANRALNELSLALSVDGAERAADKWSLGKTLRFMIVSCALFWFAVAAAFYTLR